MRFVYEIDVHVVTRSKPQALAFGRLLRMYVVIIIVTVTVLLCYVCCQPFLQLESGALQETDWKYSSLE